MRWLFVFFAVIQSLFLGALSNPPAPPLPPVVSPPYLPVVLVNNSGVSDDNVYFVSRGFNLAKTNPAAININTGTGVGTLVSLNEGDNAQTYTLKLSQLPLVPGSTNAHYFYSPQIVSATIWFSINQSISVPVISTAAGPRFSDPNFLSPADPYFTTNYALFEYSYGTDNQVWPDATAVSWFSLNLYGYLSTPAGITLSNSGLAYSENSIFSRLNQFFESALGTNEVAQWKNLALGSRYVSPGKGTTTPTTSTTQPFDSNYLDNAAAYGYSFLQDIWYGPVAYYKNHTLTMTLPNAPNRTYTGQVQSDNTFLFTSTDGNTVTFAAPSTTANPTTTQMIFQGLDMHITDTTSTGDGVQVSTIFQDAIIAGLIPTTDELSNTYFRANQSRFYTINSNLSPAGKTSGPWYDLYSAALHSYAIDTGTPSTTPTIYAFAFDESLWPQVLMNTTSITTSPETYLGVTIYPIQNGNTSQVSLGTSGSPSDVGQTVTFTATVTGSGATPTGTVIFLVDGIREAFVALSNGVATYSTSSLSAGSHQVIADYNGDSNYDPATSNSLNQVVHGVVTTVNLTSSSNPSIIGQAVTFTATVTDSGSTPTGAVIFEIDGTQVASVALSNGVATYSISSLTLGSHNVIANYLGEGTFDPSVSETLVQRIVNVNPPRQVHGEQFKNRFVSQTDIFNKITWKSPSSGNVPVSYKIYDDASLTELLAVVTAKNHSQHHFKYAQHNCVKGKTYTYYILSVDAQGGVSSPVEVVVHGHN